MKPDDPIAEATASLRRHGLLDDELTDEEVRALGYEPTPDGWRREDEENAS